MAADVRAVTCAQKVWFSAVIANEIVPACNGRALNFTPFCPRRPDLSTRRIEQVSALRVMPRDQRDAPRPLTI